MRDARESVARSFRRRVERLLDQAAHGRLTESELLGVERLARVLELNERYRSSHLPLLLISALVTGLLLLAIKQHSVDVRITLQSRGATIQFSVTDQIPIHLGGERIAISDAAVISAPASVRQLLSIGSDENVTLEVMRGGSVSLDRLAVTAGSRLAFRSEGNGVELEVSCSQNCDSHRVILTAFGPIRVSTASDSLSIPTGIEFRPRQRKLKVYLSRADTLGTEIQGPLPIERMLPEVPRFQGRPEATSVAAASSVVGGVIAFGEYGKRNRSLMPGDELELAGDLQLQSIELRSKMMVFAIHGRATTLRLGGEDLRPSVWDWVRMRPAWQLLAAFVSAVGAYVALFKTLHNLK